MATEETKKNETPPSKTQKEVWMERNRSARQAAAGEGVEINDDEEEIYGSSNRDYEELERLRENDRKFNDFFDRYPQYAGMMSDAVNGRDWATSLVERFGKDYLMAILNGEESPEELSKAEAERQKREMENKKFEEERDVNLKKSIDTINEFIEENKLDSETDGLNIWNQAVRMVDEGVHGIFTKEFLNMIFRAGNYDKAVQEAGEEGEIRGRNAAIDAKLEKSGAPADIPPAMGGGGGRAEENVPPKGKKTWYNPFRGREEEIDENKKYF